MPGPIEVRKLFLSSPKYAVVGASKVQSKFGTKVTSSAKEEELEGIRTVHQLSDLPSPTETSVSIITPPTVTLGILEQAKALSIPALWLQPGAEDEAVRKYVNDNGLGEKVVYGCILVEGDGVIKSML
ncbi:hypothetical protein EIP86_001003 [Pleurotus ostreatoroseus]|nr:hypothetical protein EIP86_001003 [Pleurotus ostreatoroseus]